MVREKKSSVDSLLKDIKAQAKKAEERKIKAEHEIETLNVEISGLQKKKNSLASIIKEKEDASREKIEAMEKEKQDDLNQVKEIKAETQRLNDEARIKLEENEKKEKSLQRELSKAEADEINNKEKRQKLENIRNMLNDALK